MTKQEVEQNIKEMLLKHPSFKDAEIEIIFKDKKENRKCEISKKR